MRPGRGRVCRETNAKPCLQEQLEALEVESKEASISGGKARPGSPAYIQWRGNTYTVFGERLKGNIQVATQLVPQLERARERGDREEQQAALESLIAAFNEAKGIVRHSLATSGGARLILDRHDVDAEQRNLSSQFALLPESRSWVVPLCGTLLLKNVETLKSPAESLLGGKLASSTQHVC